VAYSPDGSALLISGPGVLGVWDASSGQPLHTLDAPATGSRVTRSAEAACWAPGSGAVLVATTTGVSLIELATGKELQRFGGAIGVRAVAVAPDGRAVAAAGTQLTLWEPEKLLVPTLPAGDKPAAPDAGKAGQ
jgi:hypothetical protein